MTKTLLYKEVKEVRGFGLDSFVGICIHGISLVSVSHRPLWDFPGEEYHCSIGRWGRGQRIQRSASRQGNSHSSPLLLGRGLNRRQPQTSFSAVTHRGSLSLVGFLLHSVHCIYTTRSAPEMRLSLAPYTGSQPLWRFISVSGLQT